MAQPIIVREALAWSLAGLIAFIATIAIVFGCSIWS